MEKENTVCHPLVCLPENGILAKEETRIFTSFTRSFKK